LIIGSFNMLFLLQR